MVKIRIFLVNSYYTSNNLNQTVNSYQLKKFGRKKYFLSVSMITAMDLAVFQQAQSD